MNLNTEKCIEGWTNSLCQLRIKADIAFFGDSLTFWGDYASVFPDKVVCNLGLRGDTLEGMVKRVEQVACVNPECVFIMGGINDVSVISPDEFGNLYSTLVDKVFELHSKPRVFLQSILPVNEHCFGAISCNNSQIRVANRIIKNIANNKHISFLDLFSLYELNGELKPEFSKDGIHLKQHAYKIWYDLIKAII